MPGDQEENRCRPEGDEHRINQTPWLAEVDLKKDDSKEVAEQSVQQAKSFNRLKVFASEQFYRGAHHKT